jgi:hypothetical protein
MTSSALTGSSSSQEEKNKANKMEANNMVGLQN